MGYIEDIEKIVAEYAVKTEAALKRQLSWTENLKDNIRVVVNGSDMELIMPDYGIFVEFGRRPGKQPPLNVIYNWCESKRIPTSAAFPIARKIGKEGLPAHPFLFEFNNNLKDLTKDIADILVKRIVEDLES